jgi:hypothetical protein
VKIKFDFKVQFLPENKNRGSRRMIFTLFFGPGKSLNKSKNKNKNKN